MAKIEKDLKEILSNMIKNKISVDLMTVEYYKIMDKFRGIGLVEQNSEGEFKIKEESFKNRIFDSFVADIKGAKLENAGTDMMLFDFIINNYNLDHILESKDLLKFIVYLDSVQFRSLISERVNEFLKNEKVLKAIEVMKLVEK